MPWPVVNKNAAQNIVCWLCEHFQRRRSDEGTTDCQGECRKSPPSINDSAVNNFTAVSAGEVDAFFAYIPYGNTSWCSGFQRSLEENIPSVISGQSNCDKQSWSDWNTPYDIDISGPPMELKKPIEETCWYCDHYQVITDGANPTCNGNCMIAPPDGYLNENYDYGAGINRIGFSRVFPHVNYAAWKWCSKWERSRQPVDDPPESGGVICKSGV